MRKTIVSATFLMFGASAAIVGAKNNVALNGSDTLEELTRAVLAACPLAVSNGVTYAGGGSGTGGTAMQSGAQTVAPQSRAISTAEACPLVGSVTTKGAQAEGLVLALDGLA